jgi:hypothetical protein
MTHLALCFTSCNLPPIKYAHYFNKASRYDDVWENGGTAASILDVVTRWLWLALRPGRSGISVLEIHTALQLWGPAPTVHRFDIRKSHTRSVFSDPPDNGSAAFTLRTAYLTHTYDGSITAFMFTLGDIGLDLLEKFIITQLVQKFRCLCGTLNVHFRVHKTSSLVFGQD